MKGDKKSKSKSKMLSSAVLDEKQNIGALKNRTLCFTSVDGTRRLIQIIDSELKNLQENSKKLNEFSYKYYISFLELDRRFDCWIERNDIEFVTS